MAKNIKQEYLRFTEESNSLDYLEKAYFFIQQTENDRVAWKWVLLSLHGALYGFAICALKGTNPENVIDFINRHKTTRRLENLPPQIMKKGFPVKMRYNKQRKELIYNGSMPNNDREKILQLSKDKTFINAINRIYLDSRRLISFNEAIKRCQTHDYMQMTLMSKVLKLSSNQKYALKKLKDDFRDNIEHYIPRSWAIEIHGMPDIANDLLDIIRFLAVETGNYTYLKQSEIKKVKSLVYQSKRILKNSKLYKEASS